MPPEWIRTAAAAAVFVLVLCDLLVGQSVRPLVGRAVYLLGVIVDVVLGAVAVAVIVNAIAPGLQPTPGVKVLAAVVVPAGLLAVALTVHIVRHRNTDQIGHP